MTLYEILMYIGYCLVVIVGSLTGFVVWKLKGSNAETREKEIGQYQETIKKATEMAEKTGLNGATKKVFAQSQVTSSLRKNKQFLPDDETISRDIDSYVAYSKQVNAKSKAVENLK